MKLLLIIIITSMSLFALNSAELNINRKDLEIKFTLDIGQYNYLVDPDTTYIYIKYLNASDENSDIDEIGSHNFYEFGFLKTEEFQQNGLELGLGVKSNYTKIKNQTFSSIPIGVEIGYRLPIEMFIKIRGLIYYAPEPLSFSSAKEYIEYRAEGNIAIGNIGFLIFGYRNINTDITYFNQDVEFRYNESVYVGLKLEF